MIQLPRRSVTRFFIPLIDVLILLFAFFLLILPLQAGAEAEAAGDSAKDELKRREDDLKKREDDLKKREDNDAEAEKALTEKDARLRQDIARKVVSGLVVRELYTDPSTGALYHLDPDRVEIRTEDAARSYIRQMHDEAPGREVFFLIHQDATKNMPTGPQFKTYLDWFGGEGKRVIHDSRAKGEKP